MTALSQAALRLHPTGISVSTLWAKWLPTFLAIGMFWILLLNQQRLEWTVNPVYSYGWAVPVLAAYLFLARWSDRPLVGTGMGSRRFLLGVCCLLAAYLPIRVIQEANPDWVKINWLMLDLWLGLVLLVLHRAGGRSYAWHFIFPLLFCFTALPWPVWMEEAVTQNLMRWNAAVSAELLTLLGSPAMARGNLIQVGDHWVNVEEACSGIRSLQTAFMTALFLGEFYRMKPSRRGVLLLASIASAFVVNLVRTVVLSGLASASEIERWHDIAGISAMIVCIALLWILAELLKGVEPRLAGGRTEIRQETLSRSVHPTVPLGWTGAVTICCWLFAVEGMVWGWYHWHERSLPPPQVWSLHWPRQAAAFVEGKFSDRMSALLKFNGGATASWKTDEGYVLQMYYLQWEQGRVSRFLSSAHYPTVCLPANGLTLVSETGVWHCPVDGVDLPFTTYVFDEGGQDVYVFHAVVEDRPASSGTRLSYRQVSSFERIDSVLRGERNLGQHVLGIAVRGPLSPTEARKAVSGILAAVVDIRPATAASAIASTP